MAYVIFCLYKEIKVVIMQISQNISIAEDYVHVQTEDRCTCGGNQGWFHDHIKNKNTRLENGGCGLVASCDLILYLLKRKINYSMDTEEMTLHEKRRTFIPRSFIAHPLEPINREAYVQFLRKTSMLRYPIFPKLGSFNFEVLLYVNRMLRKINDERHLHFLWNNTKANRTRIIKEQLSLRNPVILILGQHFFRFGCKKGVHFYRMEKDHTLTLAAKDIFCHFVTITGIYYPEDASKSMYLEITSWGKQYYIDYEQLCDYIKKYSMPWYTGIFYLK